MSLRNRNWLLEERSSGKILSKLPPKTNIADGSGMKFSSWGGDVALVTTNTYNYSSERYFDPRNISRLYQVRYAIDPTTRKPFKSDKYFLGFEPNVLNPHVPYEKTGFRIPTSGWGHISGGFSKSKDIWVKVKPKDLLGKEIYAVVDDLERKGYYESTRGMSSSDWKKAFKAGYEGSWDIFNDKKMRDIEDAGYRGKWDRLSGVYARTKQGKIKYIIPKK